MPGHRIGGVNVFGGGLGLYNAKGTMIGGVGVSAKGDDNINYKGLVPAPSLPNDFSQPICKIAGVDRVSAISAALPAVQKVH